MVEALLKAPLEVYQHIPSISVSQKRIQKENGRKESFQPSWYTKWTWLYYMEDQGAVMFYMCQSKFRKEWSSYADLGFIST